MKKQVLFFAAMAAIALSCNKEAESEQIPVGNEITEITANFAESDTKTVLADDAKTVLWSPNDEISVFFNSTGVKFTSLNNEPVAWTVFTCKYPLIYGGTENAEKPYIYSIYPYSDSNAQKGETLTLTVPAIQTGVEGSFARGAFPSVGRSKDANISFYNVCGGIRFTVDSTGITRITITGNNNEVLAGKVKVQFDEEGHPAVTEAVEGSTSVTLNAPLSTGFEVGRWYYISTLPVILTNGFNAKLYKADGKEGQKTISSPLEVKRSSFGSLSEIDKDVIFKQGIKSITLSQTELNMAPLTTVELTYTITPVDAEYEWLKWESSNESVATVNDGVVTAQEVGNCTITLKSDNGCAAVCELKVCEPSIIIKEAYVGGFTDGTGKAVTMTDTYIILYNNSPVDADASDVVITFAAPYGANGTNKYYNGGTLLYENENWIPAYGAIWWFKSSVTIPAYSQIVVACYGAIDHTQTYAASVDLSKADYYWMSNVGVSQYTNAKYTCSDNIPETHHMTCSPFNTGNAWALSTIAPALYIGRMKAAEAEKLSKDSESYDHTLGTSAAFNVVKFPKANVVDAVEIYSESFATNSNARFPAAINTGYTVLTNKLGHTTYRNVDKAATEALKENAGKLVNGYSADPSGIDAEASIKKGAHIIYMDTNSSTNDFHQREVASLK